MSPPKLSVLTGPARTTIVCGLIGVLISWFVGSRLYNIEGARIFEEFKRDVDVYAALIEVEVSEHIAVIQALRALFDSSVEVTRSEFNTFTGFLLSHYPGIQALEWAPRVLADARDEFEKQARSEGVDAFEIRESGSTGMVRASERDEYYPVYYLEPLTGNEPALGYDLASDPIRRQALLMARDSGKVSATGRIRLVQEVANEWGVLILLPVYSGKPMDTEERRRTMRGTIVGVLRFHDLLIAAGVERPGDGQIHVEFFDKISDGNIEYLDQTEGDDIEVFADYRYERSLRTVDGRQRTLVARVSKAYVSQRRTLIPYLAVAVGFFMTCLTMLYFGRLAREKDRIEKQVLARTQALRAERAALLQSNAEIQREIGERKSLQRRLIDATDHEQRRLGQELHDSLGQQVAIISLLAQSLAQKHEDAAEPVSKEIHRLIKSAEEAQAQVRGLSKGLLPVEISQWGLPSALQQLAESTTNVSGARVEFEAEDGVTVNANQVAMHLYRIAQEAVRNALVHGQVSRVSVTLRSQDDCVLLQILDDGKGFHEASGGSGSGLPSMRYRADLIGAAFNVSSPPTGGTLVTCSLPRSADKEPDDPAPSTT